jgi:hypothetical protein
MPRSKDPMTYPKSFFDLTVAATLDEVWIPLESWGKACNLRQSLYGFWKACRDAPPEGFGKAWENVALTIEEREGVYGILVYPKSSDRDWKARAVEEALSGVKLPEPTDAPDLSYLNDYFSKDG